MIDEDIESKLAALCLIIMPYTWHNGLVREEFVRILERLYNLSNDQRAWCLQMLTDEENIERNSKVIRPSCWKYCWKPGISTYVGIHRLVYQ